jgi:Flp pilus assembly protein CpaB
VAINSRPQYNAGTPAAKPRSGRAYMLLGLVLAVLGFGMVILFTSLSGGKAPATASAVSANVVVASRDISSRTPITASDVSVVHYVLGDVPPGAYKQVSDVKGLVAEVQIMKGQPLTSNLLAKSPDAVSGPQPAYLPIPSGWVGLTIPTGEQQGVGGYISPGDYITITASVAGKNGTNVRTLYTNVHVLRVGPAQATDAAAQSSSAPKSGGITSSLTVVVTQCQAEYLNWFVANAQIKYTLESYQDYKPQDTSADATCPNVSSANGVTHDNVAGRWPGIFN